jgi:hypothetical protein
VQREVRLDSFAVDIGCYHTEDFHFKIMRQYSSTFFMPSLYCLIHFFCIESNVFYSCIASLAITTREKSVFNR